MTAFPCTTMRSPFSTAPLIWMEPKVIVTSSTAFKSLNPTVVGLSPAGVTVIVEFNVIPDLRTSVLSKPEREMSSLMSFPR